MGSLSLTLTSRNRIRVQRASTRLRSQNRDAISRGKPASTCTWSAKEERDRRVRAIDPGTSSRRDSSVKERCPIRQTFYRRSRRRLYRLTDWRFTETLWRCPLVAPRLSVTMSVTKHGLGDEPDPGTQTRRLK